MVETYFFLFPAVFAVYFIDPLLNLRGSDSCTFNDREPTETWKVALATWGRAGFLEELVKYLAIRKLVHKPYVVDPRSFLVYGFLAGTTFGFVENISYGIFLSVHYSVSSFLRFGLYYMVFRCFVNVTVHGIWGLLTAASMVRFRFIQQDAKAGVQWHGVRLSKSNNEHANVDREGTLLERVAQEIWMPLTCLPLAVGLHGLWNFLLLYPRETCAVVFEGGPDFDGDGDEDAILGGLQETARPDELLACQVGSLLLALLHAPLLRLRVVMTERSHPPDLHHDVHKKIA